MAHDKAKDGGEQPWYTRARDDCVTHGVYWQLAATILGSVLVLLLVAGIADIKGYRWFSSAPSFPAGVDLDHYCQSLGFQGAAPIHGTVSWYWQCVDGPNGQPQDVVMQAACAWQYPGVAVWAQPPPTPVPSATLPASLSNGRGWQCQSISPPTPPPPVPGR